jgi:hypothetical protein
VEEKMNKKLIGIATIIILILGIIFGIGIRSIKANPRLNQPAAKVKVVVLNNLGANTNLKLLANLRLKQLKGGLDRQLSSRQLNKALPQNALKGLQSPNVLTGNNLDLLLPGLSS